MICDGRELECKTFSTACWNQGKCVLLRLCCIDELALVLSKLFVAEHKLVGLSHLLIPFKFLLPLCAMILASTLIPIHFVITAATKMSLVSICGYDRFDANVTAAGELVTVLHELTVDVAVSI